MLLTQRELRFLEEFQYALRLNKRGDHIFEAIFDGVNFDCGNPTKEEFVSLIRKIYLNEKGKEKRRSKINEQASVERGSS